MPVKTSDPGAALSRLTSKLSSQVETLQFSPPVTHIYNPLNYARRSHFAFLKKWARQRPKVLLVGMNPGPWGMAQTGVPFGDPPLVQRWLQIEEPVTKPVREHPKRPVLGFESHRREGSGKRLWGWAEQRFGTPEEFFRTFWIQNYCPLCFLEESGRNRTPVQIPARELLPLQEICDAALRKVVEILQPRSIAGVGKFAEARAKAALPDSKIPIGSILHPSPANPAANRDWVGTVEKQLKEFGVL